MKKAKLGRTPIDPKKGRMTKRLAIWMHADLLRQLVSEAKAAGVNVRDWVRTKLSKKP